MKYLLLILLLSLVGCDIMSEKEPAIDCGWEFFDHSENGEVYCCVDDWLQESYDEDSELCSISYPSAGVPFYRCNLYDKDVPPNDSFDYMKPDALLADFRSGERILKCNW